MDFEAPVDAWYIWVGVAVVSLVLVGVVLSLPTQPPPDADRAASTVDRVGGSASQAAASYEHDADEVRVTAGKISMRNDGGTDHAPVAFGTPTPVAAVPAAVDDAEAVHDALVAILHDGHPADVRAETGVETQEVVDAVAATNEYVASGEMAWRPATGTLTVRQVSLGNETLVLIDG